MAFRGRLDGSRCLIVGGTGGIGLAIARRFLAEGARVALAGLEGAGADATTGRPTPLEPGILEEPQSLGPCAGWSMNATRPLEVALLFDDALEFLDGRLDILVHAAGGSGRRSGDGPLHECSDLGWQTVMDTNALATFLTNRAAVQIMLRQEVDSAGLRGSVLNIGSVLDRSPAPRYFGTIAYAASKGAVRALTRAAAARYAADRIRFNLLAPGLIDTPMSARAVGDPKIQAYLSTKQPLRGGPGDVADVAHAALSLCEPEARFVTGVELEVDGGWSLCDAFAPPWETHEP